MSTRAWRGPRVSAWVGCVCILMGCTVNAKGPEEDPLTDGKEDGAARTREHTSAIQEIGEIGTSFTDDTDGHAWRITLGTQERISLFTARYSGEPEGDEVDTVIYLFRRGENGRWGHYLRRNDDARPDTLYSRIDAELDPGEYRILVKAHDRAARGTFGVNVRCDDGRCEFYAPVDPDPREPGMGSPDAVGTGLVSVRIPLLDENDERPMSRFNDALTAAGLPTFPDTVTVTSDDPDLNAFVDLHAQSERDDVTAITEGWLLTGGPGSLLDAGLCYAGDGAALPDFLATFADLVFGDMFSVWGWRAGARSAYDAWHEPTTLSPVYAAWQAFDPTSGDVFIVYSDDDDGYETVMTIPACE